MTSDNHWRMGRGGGGRGGRGGTVPPQILDDPKIRAKPVLNSGGKFLKREQTTETISGRANYNSNNRNLRFDRKNVNSVIICFFTTVCFVLDY